MEILVIGTGYVGLVTGICFAEMGHQVTCLDIDHNKIEGLKHLQLPFVEPGLEELLIRNIKGERLNFTTDYASAVKRALVCFIAVPTPSKEDGSCDLSYVLSATREIAEHMDEYKVIVNKSTVVPGTTRLVETAVAQCLEKLNKPIPYDIVSNPEFLKEGAAVADCMKPDRIIIGTTSTRAIKLMKEIYAPFTINHDRILVMDPASAEMTKLAANAMLAARISLMNEIASVCEKVGADINRVRIGVGADARIGYDFLYAGVGYGGSCFPKDVLALEKLGQSHGEEMRIIHSVHRVNTVQKKLMGRKIASYFNSRGGIEDKVIAIWGLSFKPETDDVREAPALTLIEQLLMLGAHVRLYDPVSAENAKAVLGENAQITWTSDKYEAAFGADAVVLMTEWKQFRFVNFERIKKLMRGNVIFDGRNQYKHEELVAHGFDHFGIGCPPFPKTTQQEAHAVPL